jgi:hypothetical protein
MSVSDKDRNDKAVTFVLPPILTQHELPADAKAGRRPAARMQNSCANSTPRTLNNCFYRSRGALAPE